MPGTGSPSPHTPPTPSTCHKAFYTSTWCSLWRGRGAGRGGAHCQEILPKGAGRAHSGGITAGRRTARPSRKGCVGSVTPIFSLASSRSPPPPRGEHLRRLMGELACEGAHWAIPAPCMPRLYSEASSARTLAAAQALSRLCLMAAGGELRSVRCGTPLLAEAHIAQEVWTRPLFAGVYSAKVRGLVTAACTSNWPRPTLRWRVPDLPRGVRRVSQADVETSSATAG